MEKIRAVMFYTLVTVFFVCPKEKLNPNAWGQCCTDASLSSHKVLSCFKKSNHSSVLLAKSEVNMCFVYEMSPYSRFFCKVRDNFIGNAKEMKRM